MTLPIVDLAAVCDRLAARNRAVFERVGRWVAAEPDPETQRWWSTAAHRHAWHADLWAARRPVIPATVPDPPPATEPDDDRVGWYLAELDALSHDVEALDARIDADLDPATRRVVRLVGADLDELARRAPAR